MKFITAKVYMKEEREVGRGIISRREERKGYGNGGKS